MGKLVFDFFAKNRIYSRLDYHSTVVLNLSFYIIFFCLRHIAEQKERSFDS